MLAWITFWGLVGLALAVWVLAASVVARRPVAGRDPPHRTPTIDMPWSLPSGALFTQLPRDAPAVLTPRPPMTRCDLCPAYGCTMCQHDIDAIRERFERGDGMETYVLPTADRRLK